MTHPAAPAPSPSPAPGDGSRGPGSAGAPPRRRARSSPSAPRPGARSPTPTAPSPATASRSSATSSTRPTSSTSTTSTPTPPRAASTAPGASAATTRSPPSPRRATPPTNAWVVFDSLMVSLARQPRRDVRPRSPRASPTRPTSSWVSFKMRPEARFSDGSPLTAEDVVFTFDMMKTKGQLRYRAYFGDIEKVEALGPHEVKFTFRRGRRRPRPPADRRRHLDLLQGLLRGPRLLPRLHGPAARLRPLPGRPRRRRPHRRLHAATRTTGPRTCR